jgi:peptidoglycan/LPS O-acetylase OafA/YrhL
MVVRTLGHVPALDGLRGIAILMVLALHANQIPGGALGVDLFFVLSGFLITALLLGEWTENGAISLRRFYVRRARRLLPALVVMLAGFVALSSVLEKPDVPGWNGRDALEAAGLSLAYSVNIVQAFDSRLDAQGGQHLWSLAQEEQFYALWPTALLLLLLVRCRPGALIAGLAVVFASLWAWRIGLIVGDASYERVWFGPDTHADGLIVGAICGVLFSYGLVAQLRTALVWAAIAVATVVTAISAWDTDALYTYRLPLFCLASGVIVLAAATNHPHLRRAPLAMWPLGAVGRISYGLYLWHYPLFLAFGWKIGMPVAITVAGLSYHYVEKPFLRSRRGAVAQPTRPVEQATTA